MVAVKDKPLMHFATQEEFERFLENDPPDSGIRLQLVKKGDTRPGLSWAEAVDVALCFGWIDSQAAGTIDGYRVQVFTPRRARSPWSQINIANTERLIAEGRMRPAGQAEIDRAKADGRWDAAYRVKDAAPSPELQAALDASPAASATWDAMTKQNRFAIIFRTTQPKLPETRTRKIAEFIAMLEKGQTIY